MVYYCKFLMMGFTPAEAWQLWKYKLSLFNTKTYNVLKYCWLKFVILREKLRQNIMMICAKNAITAQSEEENNFFETDY